MMGMKCIFAGSLGREWLQTISSNSGSGSRPVYCSVHRDLMLHGMEFAACLIPICACRHVANLGTPLANSIDSETVWFSSHLGSS